MSYELLKWLHVLSGTLLVGGGFGSAFHLVLASYRRDPSEAAAAAHKILRFDGAVGAPTALFQVAGGLVLARQLELSLHGGWIAASLALFAVALAIWVPVIALEFRMRRLARDAARASAGLPRDYWRAFFV